MDHQTQWTEVLSVGVGQIDEEHKHFIRLLDRFNHSETRGLPESELYAMLAEVMLYTEEHFTNEEALMQAAGYPFVNEHRMQHDLAENEVHRLASGSASEEEIRKILGRFLLNWLILHIQSADRKFGLWLKEQGRGPVPEPETVVCDGDA
ncbi:MAG TPA: bacteriohemerythrin [Azospirillum sp.]|nr:bacteriohemerythrin [Azospirillum sp.]